MYMCEPTSQGTIPFIEIKTAAGHLADESRFIIPQGGLDLGATEFGLALSRQYQEASNMVVHPRR
jgi:hypothetical protein